MYISTYLQGSTRPKIEIAVHQCASFCNNTRLVHKRAVRRISNYLTSTSNYVNLLEGNRWLTTHSVFYSPKIEKCIECFVYQEFAGEWDQEDADNAENFMLHTGYVITYARCPVLWCSKLQI